MLSCSNSVGTPVKKDRRSSEVLKRTSKRYQDTVLWVWFKMFFTPKRYKDPVLWVWLEMFFTPKRYQDHVSWVWLEVFFTLKRYQDPVLWVGLEVFFTLNKRYQDPVLRVCVCGLKCFSPLRGTKIMFCGFGLKCFFTPKRYDEHPPTWYWSPPAHPPP